MPDAQAMRPDPCTLIYGVAEPFQRDDQGNLMALDMWKLMAEKAGWSVTVVERSTASDQLGLVDIEGIQYSVHLGPRKRQLLVDGSTGEPVRRPVLRRAVWVVPVITDELLVTYP
jgi:hypothetical protein